MPGSETAARCVDLICSRVRSAYQRSQHSEDLSYRLSKSEGAANAIKYSFCRQDVFLFHLLAVLMVHHFLALLQSRFRELIEGSSDIPGKPSLVSMR